jgi:hypothetical protein
VGLITSGEIADRLGVQLWRVQLAINKGLIRPAGRVGRNRVFHEHDLAAIADALRAAGYLKDNQEVARVGN